MKKYILAWRGYCGWFFIAIGILIWAGDYGPAVLLCESDCLYVAARHMFFFNQIVLTAAGVCLAFLLFKRKIAWKEMAVGFGAATLLTYIEFFYAFHDWLVAMNLYPIWFKTVEGGKGVGSFQYARVYLLILIAGLFYANMCRRDFRTFDRLLWAWFFAALCVFMFSMHRVVGRMAFTDYQEEVVQQIERTLKTRPQLLMEVCKKIEYTCMEWDLNQSFDASAPAIKNRLWVKKDSKEMIDSFIEKDVLTPIRKGAVGDIKILSEGSLSSNNLVRAISFGAIKTNESKAIVLIDYHKTSYALDKYLVLFTVLMVWFLLVWGACLYWVRSFHTKRKVMQ